MLRTRLGPPAAVPTSPRQAKAQAGPKQGKWHCSVGSHYKPAGISNTIGVVMVAHIGYIGGKCHWPHFRPGPGQLGKYSNTDNGGIYR